MEFDITNIDLRTLTRAIIANAEPKGVGKLEYTFRKERKDLVDSISDEELELVLYDFESLIKGTYRLFDYYKGKPIKLDLRKKANGRITANTTGYDTRNGMYSFLEVLLTFFSHDEIRIIRKGYGHMNDFDFPKNEDRDELDLFILNNLVKTSIKKQDEFGRFWTIDMNNSGYKSALERFYN